MQGNFDERARVAKQLEAIEGRFEELTVRISLPEVAADGALFSSLMRERSELEELAELAALYRERLEELEETKELLYSADGDIAAMAGEELARLEPLMEAVHRAARLALLPKDPDDFRNAIVEVRAGAGGDEAGLFGAELVRMYALYAASRGWKVELTEDGSTEIGGIKESVMLIQGKNVFSRLKYESGVHRVQRVPVTESSGRIHTSTATVAVLPEAEEVEIEVNPADLRIDTYRASGAGGQHINRTDSAVRITHVPTGIVVQSQDERSQMKNRDRAMRILRSRLYDERRRQTQGEYASARKSQVGTGDRSERIRTYNFPQGRVTDHRIGLTLYRIGAIIGGDLDEVIDALILAEQTVLLKGEG